MEIYEADEMSGREGVIDHIAHRALAELMLYDRSSEFYNSFLTGLFVYADQVTDIRTFAGKHFVIEILLPVHIVNTILQCRNGR